MAVLTRSSYMNTYISVSSQPESCDDILISGDTLFHAYRPVTEKFCVHWDSLPAHPSTNPAMHSWESNLQLVDYKFYILTITLPSHFNTQVQINFRRSE